MPMRRGWVATLAACFVLLSGCAALPPQTAPQDSAPEQTTEPSAPTATAPSPTESDDAGSDSPPPTGPPGNAAQNRISGLVFVSANSNTWQVEVTEVGEADLEDVVMYENEEPAEAPGGRDRLVWVCFTATQTSGYPGSWIGDDFRFELWSTSGTHFDHLTAIDYAMADEDQDVYFAQGNDLDEAYADVCALFVVPRDMPLDQVMLVPDDGEPLLLEL